jgi:hypothetical protein
MPKEIKENCKEVIGARFATYLILFGAKRQTAPSGKPENTLSSLQTRQ